MKKYPSCFFALAQVPVLDGKPATDEWRRAIAELGLRGVAITWFRARFSRAL
jgi:predicted TIM-barrel fold metal-dependent hydrolase